MTATFDKSRLPRVKVAQWKRLAPILGQEPVMGFMAHDLGNQASIPYDMAYAVLLALYDNNLADAQWLIYHRCAEHPVRVTKFEKGIPTVPAVCPDCEDPTEENEFTFDVRFKLFQAVEFK